MRLGELLQLAHNKLRGEPERVTDGMRVHRVTRMQKGEGQIAPNITEQQATFTHALPNKAPTTIYQREVFEPNPVIDYNFE